MKPLVLAMVLGAAVLHAGWNALAKKGGDPLVRMAFIAGGSGLCGLPLALWCGMPHPGSWPMLLGSALVHQAYYSCLVLGYRSGDLSTVYPIARGTAPMLVALGAALFADEHLDAQGIAAVLVIGAGVASIAFSDGWRRDRRAVGYALATAVTIALYSLLDGLGGRAAGPSVLPYVSWLFFLQGIPLVLFTVLRRRDRLGAALRAHYRGGLIGGGAAFVGYGLVIWAMRLTPLSYVAALREVSVILAALLGTKLLGEPFGRRRLAAAAVVVLGVIWLQVSQV